MSNIITIPNIENYNQRIVDGSLILTPTIADIGLCNEDLRGSYINECIIDGVIINIKKYTPLLLNIYETMEKESIIQNTILNNTEEKNHLKGFKYYEKIGLSIQGADSRRMIKEIINMIKIQKKTIKLNICLKTDKIIFIEIK